MNRGILSLTVLACWSCVTIVAAAEHWRRHTIDRSSRGADGVRVADVNGDGLPDITTGWEQGGVIRVYQHPGREAVKKAWPLVTVGKVRSPEDAVFCDLDRDGRTDVVSCCEGRTRTIYIHWAPKEKSRYLQSAAWKTTAITATEGKQSWMFAVPLQVDGKNGTDLIVGSKGRDASVGWLEAPTNPRDAAGWKFHRLYDAGWIMSLAKQDVDGDGDQDVIVSDRKGKKAGVLWLENPGARVASRGQKWREHRIGGDGMEVMFLSFADLNGDTKCDIVCATRNGKILLLLREAKGTTYKQVAIANPGGIRNGKAVAIGDIDLDGHLDVVHNTNKGRKSDQPALTWLRGNGEIAGPWTVHDVSGLEGVKFDLIELLDLDGDGDLDIVTCEEVSNLGVFWYENPTR